MSTPDAKLSAAERAALADLEAAAAASDPGLAALLRGGAGRRIRSQLKSARAAYLGVRAVVLRARWWGVPITVAGLLLIVLGLSSAIALSMIGALVTAVGLRVIAELVQARFRRPGSEPSKSS